MKKMKILIVFTAGMLLAAFCSAAGTNKAVADEGKNNGKEKSAKEEEVKLGEEPAPGKTPMEKYSKEYAESLLGGVDDSMYPETFKTKMLMETHRRNRRTLKYTYEIYSKGGDKALMEVAAPKRDRGKKILMLKDNLWMYMPNVSRPIKLSRKQSFMGSTFSNEDMTDSTWQDDYNPVITDEKNGLVLLSLKAKRKDVAYDRIDMWVKKETKVPVSAVYYGLSGKPIKKMYFSDVKEIAGRLRPVKMKMVDLLEEGAYTVVDMKELKGLDSLPDYMFDQTQLGR